jgi:hypothetical protein
LRSGYAAAPPWVPAPGSCHVRAPCSAWYLASTMPRPEGGHRSRHVSWSSTCMPWEQPNGGAYLSTASVNISLVALGKGRDAWTQYADRRSSISLAIRTSLLSHSSYHPLRFASLRPRAKWRYCRSKGTLEARPSVCRCSGSLRSWVALCKKCLRVRELGLTCCII